MPSLTAGLAGLTPQTRRFLAGSALMGVAQAVPWTMLPLYLDRLGYTKAEIGAVQACDAWGMVLIALPAAFLLAHRRTPPILTWASLIAGLAYCALPWMPSLGLVMLLNLIAGLAWSVHYVAISPFLYRHTQAGQRTAVFGLAEAVHTAAAVAGMFLGGRAVELLTHVLASEKSALAWVVASGGLLALFAIVPYATIRESRPPAAARAHWWPVLKSQRKILTGFAVPQFLIGLGASICIPFLGLYFQDRFDLHPGQVASLQAAGQVLSTLGYLITPLIVLRLGFVKSIAGLELASIPFFLLLAWTTSLPLAILAFLMRGALMQSATPILKNLSMECSGEGTREVMNGVTGCANRIGWVVGPHLGGWLLDQRADNYHVVMLITVAIYVVAVVVTVCLLAPAERRHAETLREAQAPA